MSTTRPRSKLAIVQDAFPRCVVCGVDTRGKSVRFARRRTRVACAEHGRECPRCHQHLKLTAYNRRQTSSGKVVADSYCPPCQKAYARDWRAKQRAHNPRARSDA